MVAADRSGTRAIGVMPLGRNAAGLDVADPERTVFVVDIEEVDREGCEDLDHRRSGEGQVNASDRPAFGSGRLD